MTEQPSSISGELHMGEEQDWLGRCVSDRGNASDHMPVPVAP